MLFRVFLALALFLAPFSFLSSPFTFSVAATAFSPSSPTSSLFVLFLIVFPRPLPPLVLFSYSCFQEDFSQLAGKGGVKQPREVEMITVATHPFPFSLSLCPSQSVQNF